MPSARSTKSTRHGSKKSMRGVKSITVLTDGAQVPFQGRSDTIRHREATEYTTSEVLKMDDVIEVVCPTCGCDEASTFYRHGNEIVGCEYCLTRLERYEVAEILEEERYERDYWGEG